MAKRVAILGSTGSIGCNSIDVIEHLGSDFAVAALSAHTQVDILLKQAQRHHPTAVAITDSAAADRVSSMFKAMGVTVYVGPDGLEQMVRRDDINVVLSAVVGAVGLPAAFAAVETGKTLALANKESLVCAGSLLVPLARANNVAILPVDSEHSAIFQAIQCGRASEIRRVILTASGGPFRTASADAIKNATVADAMKHPTWKMGGKITIDSASMFNKALELIEACWLFDIPCDQIDIVVHPESVVHSMVEFIDGSVIAQLSPPDMRTPIQYALTYPHRREGNSRRLDLSTAFQLCFEPPDFERFPALRLAYRVAKEAGTSGVVLNAANEAAVVAFTSGKVSFGEIPVIVESALDAHAYLATPTLSQLLELDSWARDHVARASHA